MGRVLDALDKRDLARDTPVIFTSDNGGVFEPTQARPETVAVNAGLAVNGLYRGGKTHIYEGGFKEPFVASWPGVIPAGTACDEMISLADLLATTAAIVGQKLPPADQGAEDSINILPALLGEQTKAPLRADMVLHSNDGVFAIRKGPWKWIEGLPVKQIGPVLRKAHAAEFQRQYFNLKDDPKETTDVSAQHPEVVAELEALLNRYRDRGYSRDLTPPAASPQSAAAR